MTECTHDNILSSPDICTFIADNCGTESGYFNFISFYYCTLDQSIALLVVISLVFALLVFNFLGAISNNYLAPSLEIVSRKLKLSETMSGITLLAFAASAPDVVTGLVAGGRAESGIRIAVGGLFGACLFTITIVLAGCILGAKSIEADKKDLARDIGILMITVLYFVILTLVKEITPLLASGFFMLYIIYFLFVLFQERRKSKKIEPLTQNLLVLDVEISEEAEHDPNSRSSEPIRRGSGPITLKAAIKTEEAVPAANGLKMRYRSSWRTKMMSDYPAVTVAKHYKKVSPPKRAQTVAEISLNGHMSKVKESSDENLENNTENNNGSKNENIIELNDSEIEVEVREGPDNFHRVLKWINVPIIFIGDLTMPPVESHRWNLYMAVLAPILGPLFIIWELGFYKIFDSDWYLWFIFGGVTVAIGVLVFVMGRNRNLTEKYPGTFATITLIISVFWLNLISSLIVDFLTFIQVLTGINLYFLSITLLAWGNSLEDYFVNHAIAKKGHGKAALGGVYGSQIFAIMVGFGGGLFRAALNQTIVMDIYNFQAEGEELRGNLMIIFLIGSTIIVLIMTMIAGKINRWVLGKNIVMFVFILYAVFTLGTILIAFV